MRLSGRRPTSAMGCSPRVAHPATGIAEEQDVLHCKLGFHVVPEYLNGRERRTRRRECRCARAYLNAAKPSGVFSSASSCMLGLCVTGNVSAFLLYVCQIGTHTDLQPLRSTFSRVGKRVRPYMTIM